METMRLRLLLAEHNRLRREMARQQRQQHGFALVLLAHTHELLSLTKESRSCLNQLVHHLVHRVHEDLRRSVERQRDEIRHRICHRGGEEKSLTLHGTEL